MNSGEAGLLTKDDWTAAALTALAEGGVAAVAIEPLAARAGATKGGAGPSSTTPCGP